MKNKPNKDDRHIESGNKKRNKTVNMKGTFFFTINTVNEYAWLLEEFILSDSLLQ